MSTKTLAFVLSCLFISILYLAVFTLEYATKFGLGFLGAMLVIGGGAGLGDFIARDIAKRRAVGENAVAPDHGEQHGSHLETSRQETL